MVSSRKASDGLWVPECPRKGESTAPVSWLSGRGRWPLLAAGHLGGPTRDLGVDGAGRLHVSQLDRKLSWLILTDGGGSPLPQRVFSR